MNHLNITWEGPDGSVWDLNDGPVRITNEGIKGLGMIPTEAFVTETPTTDGQRFRGTKKKPRTIELPVMVNTTRIAGAWQAVDRAWWKSFEDDDYGTLWITDVVGEKRRIRARFSSDGDYEFATDPANLGYALAGVELIADDPWFYGELEQFTIEAPDAPPNFFGPTGYGPPFYIADSSFTGEQLIHNPGDADAWPVYEQLGPSTAFTFTVQGRTVSGRIDVPADSRLVIDTRQNRKTARLYDNAGEFEWTVDDPASTWVDVFRQLDTFDFARVPKGQTVPITILTVGAGDVRVSFTPIFKRGF